MLNKTMIKRYIKRIAAAWILPSCDVGECGRNATGDAPVGRVMCDEHAGRAWEIDGGNP